ncbi:MAG: efflux transporter outer membrane subunit [Opitutales bacterium]
MRKTIGFITSSFILVFSGCETWNAKDAPTPEIETPEAWSSDAESGAEILDAWLTDFESSELEQLVEEALEKNPSIQASMASLDAAFFNAKISGARLFPTITADGSLRRSLSNTQTGQNIYSTSANASLGVSWEIDIWGRVRDAKNAAKFDYLASEASFDAARLSLAANVARLWIQAIAAKQQLNLAESTLESYEENVEIINSRFERGISSALDLQLIRSTAASTRSSVAANKDNLDETIRSLEILLGRYPAGVLAVSDELPQVPASVPSGLPSELLERRPDIAQASARLDAAAFRRSISHKNRLPALSLTGSFGHSSSDLGDLTDPDFNVWSIFGGLGTTLFNFGRLEAEQDVATAQYVQAGHNYVSTVLGAFLEVESALTSDTLFAERLDAQREAAQASTDAETISWERYQSGLNDIVTVLEAQRRADNARRDLITQESSYLLNRVNLHLALGGAFEQAPVDSE